MAMPDRDAPYSRVEQQLAILLRRARAHSGDLAREVHPDLQAAAYGLLGRLLDCGSARAADLSEYFGVDKGTLSRQLKLLEDLQLIARSTDVADRRCQQLILTAEGQRRVTAAREARRHLLREQLAPWPTGDVEAFGNLLARFNTPSP